MSDQNEIIDITDRMTPERAQAYPRVRFLVYDDFPPDGMIVGDLGGRMFVGECGTRAEAMLISVTNNRVILRHTENADGSLELISVSNA